MKRKEFLQATAGTAVAVVAGTALTKQSKVAGPYTIRMIDLEEPGREATISCGADQYILDAAEDAGADWVRYSCRAGACSSSAARVVSGQINMVDFKDEQSFLDDDQIAAGFFLSCIAYPASDMTIKVNAEDDLY